MRGLAWCVGTTLLGFALYAVGFLWTLSEYPEGTDVPTWMSVWLGVGIVLFFGSLIALVALLVRGALRRDA